MEVRSPVTVMPVLFGEVAGVTVTVSLVVSPDCSVLGLAAPVPLRATGATLGVRLKSSTDRPSSELVASMSVKRIQNVAPLAMLNPVTVEESAVRSLGALPYLLLTVTVSGVTRSEERRVG